MTMLLVALRELRCDNVKRVQLFLNGLYRYLILNQVPSSSSIFLRPPCWWSLSVVKEQKLCACSNLDGYVM